MNKVTTYRYLLAIATAIIVGFIYYVWTIPAVVQNDKYGEQKKIIDSLTAQIYTLQKEQLQQDSIICLHKDSIAVLDHDIDLKNEEIANIRKYYGKKIKDNEYLAPPELDKFFADRYQQ